MSERSILLIDDEVNLRERLASALSKRGYQVYQAFSEESTLLALEAQTPAYVLLDLRLGAENGLEILGKIRQQAPLAKVVVLTGYGSIGSALTATRLGACDYLAKPVTVDEVERALLRLSQPQAPPKKLETPSLARVEWEHMQRVLTDCDGNISQAAKVLKIHRRSLQRKLQKYPPKQ